MKIRAALSSTILFAIALAFFASLSIASSQCYSAIAIQLSTGERINLGGFDIVFDNQLMGKTGSYGAATIPIDSDGYIEILASKEAGGVNYRGSISVQIHCFEASGGRLSVNIPVFAQGGGEAPGGGGFPWG
jgi:hypothetical protein